MRVALALTALAALIPASSASASPQPGYREAPVPQTKQGTRKAPESRDRRRAPSSSVGRGCVGCILPLDGIATVMAAPKAG